MNSRRRFFPKLFALVVGITGLTACREEGIEKNRSKVHDTEGINQATLDAVVDTFVPQDQDAGAVEAGVSEILLALFDEKEDMRNHGLALLARMEVVAQHNYQIPFHRLKLARREEIMHKTLHSRRKDDQPAKQAISILRGHIIEAFYLSPVGQTMLGYTPPYPNGYPGYHTPPVF